MKYLKWIYVVLLGAILVIFCLLFLQRRSQIKEEKIHSARTSISIEKNKINVGRVQLDHPVSADFILTNVGQNELILEDVKPDCSCTASSWNRQPIDVNKNTTLTLTYNSRNTGFFQKKAIVTGNFDESPLLILITGEVVGK